MGRKRHGWYGGVRQGQHCLRSGLRPWNFAVRRRHGRPEPRRSPQDPDGSVAAGIATLRNVRQLPASLVPRGSIERDVWFFVQVQNTAFQVANTYHKSTYSSANLIWNPVGDLDLGVEFIYGALKEKSGAGANAPRFQFTGRYEFVKLHPKKE